ncbi:MAG TPA: helix-turn-helix transcriptional regulator [Terriglobales bacterium]|nr:helix-turn-helix transcriptional regulator [Terriglobales bacterium]
MKFELAEKDVKLVDGKFVQLPMKRFVALTDYVENLESRLLAAEVNLRESARVGTEMEAMPASSVKEGLPQEEVRQVESVLRRLEPAQLRKAMEDKRVSVRRLAILTGIPYATLYRYVHGAAVPTHAAKNIWLTLSKLKKRHWQQGAAAGATKERR